MSLLFLCLIFGLWSASHFRSTSFGINFLEKCYLFGTIHKGNFSWEFSTGTIAELAPTSPIRTVSYSREAKPRVRQTLFGAIPKAEKKGGITGQIWLCTIPIWPVFLAVLITLVVPVIESRAQQDDPDAEVN